MATKNEKVDFKYSTWVGTAVTVGGSVILVDIEEIFGKVWNLGIRTDWHRFDILNLGIGPGLGGSCGGIGVVIFNARNLASLDGKEVGKGSWSLNASLGAKWGTVGKALTKYKIYAKFAKISKLIKKKAGTPDDITAIVNGLMAVQKAAGLDPKKTKKPVFFTFPIPLAGVGLRLSAAYTLTGKFELGTLRGG